MPAGSRFGHAVPSSMDAALRRGVLPREESLRARVCRSGHRRGLDHARPLRRARPYEPASPADPVFTCASRRRRHVWRRFTTKREAIDFMRESPLVISTLPG